MKLNSIFVLATLLVASGIFYYYTNQIKVPKPDEPRHFVWDVKSEELAKMAISLPKHGKNEAWVKHEDRYWYFDEPEGPKVDMKRWGGGIPLLLSGPKAERMITDNASQKQLEIFGLIAPRMMIDLTLENSKIIQINVGDSTPDAQSFYIRLSHAKEIFTIHETWYHVLERLVLEPPYSGHEKKSKPVDPKIMKRQQQDAKLARANRLLGNAYRTRYKKGSGVVELESGLLYRVIKKGDGKIPYGSDTVQVYYTGRLIDGTIFDRSLKGEPLTLGLDKIIRGWREVLQLMEEGAQWEVILPPELAYGKRGSNPKIGPNQTLFFEIELLKVRN